MGMSASQVRFLSLQSRKNSIGRQLLTLSNRKMALSRDMNTVALRYNNALNQTTLKWSNNSGSTYNALSYDLMMKPNDLNTEKPYIVTKAGSGEVILNNDELRDKDGNGLGVSYVDIAKMISSYSGLDTNNNCLYNNISNLTTTTKNNITSITGGGKSIDNAYVIPERIADFSFDTSLRYTIFQKLGLVTDEDIQKQKNIMVALYGSQDAIDKNQYPIGSAWGDYYIAVAQLESYKEYLNQKHPYSIGNTYGGMYTYSGGIDGNYDDTRNMPTKDSQNAYVTDKYDSNNYNYSALVDGNDGYTKVSQTSKATNSQTLAKVDFNSSVKSDGNGNYTVGGALTDYSGYEISDNSGSHTVGLNSNGIIATHGQDDLLQEAFTKMGNPTGEHDDYFKVNNEAKNYNQQTFLWALAHCKEKRTTTSNGNSKKGDMTYSAGVVNIYSTRSHSYYSEISGNSNIKDRLNTMCDAFTNLMKNVESTDLKNDTAYANAKRSTVQYLIQNCNNKDHIHGDDRYSWVQSRACSLASGHGLGSCGADVSGHRDYVSVAVDTGVAFDLFMTFYNHYVQNPGDTPNSLSTNEGPSIEEKSYSDITEDQYSALLKTTGKKNGNTYSILDYGTEDTNNQSFVSGKNYSLSTTQTAGSIELWIDNTDNTKYSLSQPDASIAANYTKYYATLENSFNYYSTNTNSTDSASSTSLTYNGNQVFGTAFVKGSGSTPNKLYYFTTQAQLNAYLNGSDPASTGATCIEMTASINDSTIKFDDSDPYKVIIKPNYTDSYYDSQIYDYVEDNGYLNTLETNVNDKYQRIKDLEEDLKNVNGGVDNKLMDYYDALFQRIAENGWIVDDKTSSKNNNASTYLNNKLQNNDFFVTECNEKDNAAGFNYTSKIASSIRKIYQVHDDNAENEALVEYETEKSAISAKEAKIDVIMQKLETEQEAINTTMESVQKIIQENIEKTFKMFA